MDRHTNSLSLSSSPGGSSPSHTPGGPRARASQAGVSRQATEHTPLLSAGGGPPSCPGRGLASTTASLHPLPDLSGYRACPGPGASGPARPGEVELRFTVSAGGNKDASGGFLGSSLLDGADLGDRRTRSESDLSGLSQEDDSGSDFELDSEQGKRTVDTNRSRATSGCCERRCKCCTRARAKRNMRAIARSWAARDNTWLVWHRPSSTPMWDISFGPLLFVVGGGILLIPLLLPNEGPVGPISPWWGVLPLAGLVWTLVVTTTGRVPSHFGFGWTGDSQGATLAFRALLVAYACIVFQGIALRVVDPSLSLVARHLKDICSLEQSQKTPFLCKRFGSLLNNYLYGVVAIVIVGAARFQVRALSNVEGSQVHSEDICWWMHAPHRENAVTCVP